MSRAKRNLISTLAAAFVLTAPPSFAHANEEAPGENSLLQTFTFYAVDDPPAFSEADESCVNIYSGKYNVRFVKQELEGLESVTYSYYDRGYSVLLTRTDGSRELFHIQGDDEVCPVEYDAEGVATISKDGKALPAGELDEDCPESHKVISLLLYVDGLQMKHPYQPCDFGPRLIRRPDGTPTRGKVVDPYLNIKVGPN